LDTSAHPSTLGLYQKYKQAVTLTQKSGRSKNQDWYSEPLDLNFQLHLRIDGATIVSFYFDRQKGRWSNGPALTEEVLYDSQKLATFVSEAVKHVRSLGASSLGVILYIADEFAVSELKPEFDSPGSLADLRTAAVADPSSILQDSSVASDQVAWRVLPYPASGGASIGTAVTISQHYAPFFKILREFAEKENFPIITQALSAPLIAILGLRETLQLSPNKAFIAVLQYPWFTVLACFNEHSDLRLVRTLQHRGLRRPTNFRNSLATTNAALEFIDPDLFLIPLGSNVDTALAADLQASFSASRVEIVEQTPRERMPNWCPEPIIATQPALTSSTKTSLTFQMLRGEKWAFQDFLPTPPEVAELYPTRSEIQLLQLVKIARLALIIPALIGLSYFVYSAFKINQRPESKFDVTQAAQTKARLVQLTSERSKIERLNNLLDDRSKGWAGMELFAAMFPADRGFLVKTFSLTASPDAPAVVGAVKATKSGFTRKWEVTGLVRDRQLLKQLEELSNTQYLTDLFSKVASSTGDQSYAMVLGKRAISGTFTQNENSLYKVGSAEQANVRDETTYELSFTLRVTQKFEFDDKISLDISKAK
jgi:hypothetical protein